jgi:hypothetical protein
MGDRKRPIPGHRRRVAIGPLYPRKRTFAVHERMSAQGHNRILIESSHKAGGYDSMLPRVDTKADDSLLPQCFCGLQSMQTLDQYETRAVRPH